MIETLIFQFNQRKKKKFVQKKFQWRQPVIRVWFNWRNDMSILLKVTCKSSVEIFSTDKFGFSCDLFIFSSPLTVQISSLVFTHSKVSGIWESFGDSIFDSHSSFCWVWNKGGLISEGIYYLVLSCSISIFNFFNLGWKVENNVFFFMIHSVQSNWALVRIEI